MARPATGQAIVDRGWAYQIDTRRGLSALSDEQLHRLVDRLIADDPDALKVARRLVAAQRGGEG